MTQIIQLNEQNSQIISSLVLQGDLSKMTEDQKVNYYKNFCESLGLNPLTQPFQIIKFQGKEILYATKDATEQLRKIYGVSVIELEKLFQDDLYIVTAKVQDKNGRYDAASGVVNLLEPDTIATWSNQQKTTKPNPKAGRRLTGDALANLLMKAETKAKRRATLSICGLGMLDESETDTIGNYEKVDIKTLEIPEKTNNEIAQEMFTPTDDIKKAEIVQPDASNEAAEPKKDELDPKIVEKIKTAKTVKELEAIWGELPEDTRHIYLEKLSTRKGIIKANEKNKK